MGEELHENLENNSNEEYIENKHSEGINAEIVETEESALQGKDDGKRNRILSLLHVQSIRIFCIILEYSGGKMHLLL